MSSRLSPLPRLVAALASTGSIFVAFVALPASATAQAPSCLTTCSAVAAPAHPYEFERKFGGLIWGAHYWRDTLNSLDVLWIGEDSGRIRRSDDGAKSISLTNNPTSGSVDLWASGDNVYLSQYAAGPGFAVSTDKAGTFGSLVQSATDPTTGYVLRALPHPQAAGMYVSTDGTDQLGQLSSYVASLQPPGVPFVDSAYSIGGRVIAGIYRGGLAVFEQGNAVYTNTNLQQNSGQQWIRIRVYDGTIFALGDELLASYDGGSTFAPVPGAPRFVTDIAAVGSDLYFGAGYLYVSKDNGHSFAPWTAELR